jgi:uncharacterized protein (DUF983 family)
MGRIFLHSLFRGFPKMQERCAVCDLKFEREPGYFLGAMYISYLLGVLTMAPIAMLFWFLAGWGLRKVILWAVVLFLPFAPTITLLPASRGSILTRRSTLRGLVSRSPGVLAAKS